MPRNVWSAGQDALLGHLAERDAAKRLAEDRARRERLDQEAYADRERQRSIQEGQLKSIDEDRDERRRLTQSAADEKKAATQAAALNAEQIGELLDAYDAAATPQEKHAIGLRILNAGGKYQNEPAQSAGGGFSLSPGQRRFGPDGKLIASAPERPERGTAGPKDDPRLPQGTKVWIESLAQEGLDLGTARNRLSQGWGQQRAAHPNAELAAAAAYLAQLYAPDPARVEPAHVPVGATPVSPSAPAAAAAPPPVTAPLAPKSGAESPEQQMFNDAHAIVSNHLGRNATPQEVAKFLSDPNNVAQLTKR